MSVQTVNNWRNGTMPNDDALPKLADALDLSVSEILAGEIKAIDDKAEGRLKREIKVLSRMMGTSVRIIIGLMTMLVALYVTGTINLLFGAQLGHSVGYFAWAVISAVLVFGGAYLVISGLRVAEKNRVTAGPLTLSPHGLLCGPKVRMFRPWPAAINLIYIPNAG